MFTFPIVVRLGMLIAGTIANIYCVVEIFKAMQKASETNPDLAPDWSATATAIIVFSSMILPVNVYSILLSFSVRLARFQLILFIAMVLLTLLNLVTMLLHRDGFEKVIAVYDKALNGAIAIFGIAVVELLVFTYF